MHRMPLGSLGWLPIGRINSLITRCLLVDTAECVSGTPAVLHRGPPRCGTLMFGAAPGAAYRCSTLVLLDFTVVHPCAMSYLKMYHMPPQKSQNELWYQWFCIQVCDWVHISAPFLALGSTGCSTSVQLTCANYTFFSMLKSK